MPDGLTARIEFARKTVCGQIAFFQKYFSHVESRWKEDNSRVTDADLALSKFITGQIRETFPQDDLCSEEDLPKENTPRFFNAEFAWILDPIDGTNNFARGMPQCAISLAILRNGVPVYGLIYDNAKKAVLEGGETLGLLQNGEKFVPAKAAPFDEHSIVSMHFPVRREILDALAPFLTVNPFRCQGSAALNLAYNAFGSIDGSFDFKTKVWDIAAACAMLAASDKKIEFLKNNPFPLKQISRTMPEIQWFAGTPDFMERVRQCVRF